MPARPGHPRGPTPGLRGERGSTAHAHGPPPPSRRPTRCCQGFTRRRGWERTNACCWVVGPLHQIQNHHFDMASALCKNLDVPAVGGQLKVPVDGDRQPEQVGKKVKVTCSMQDGHPMHHLIPTPIAPTQKINKTCHEKKHG